MKCGVLLWWLNKILVHLYLLKRNERLLIPFLFNDLCTYKKVNYAAAFYY